MLVVNNTKKSVPNITIGADPAPLGTISKNVFGLNHYNRSSHLKGTISNDIKTEIILSALRNIFQTCKLCKTSGMSITKEAKSIDQQPTITEGKPIFTYCTKETILNFKIKLIIHRKDLLGIISLNI